MKRVAVLGAGLQGACVAMELADTGFDVDLYDRLEAPLLGTSAHNDGKIHLGYVYANDASLRTARMMVRGAFCFRPLLRRWIGADVDRIPVSPPFHYAVHRDSLVDPEGIERHFESCHELARREAVAGEMDYFGRDALRRPERLASYDHLFAPEQVSAAFRTQEIGVDTVGLSDLVRARLATAPRIRCLMGATVTGVELGDHAVDVVFDAAGESHRHAYAHVVNALWEGRLKIDQSVGLYPSRPWLFRRRHYLRVQAEAGAAATVPCSTIIVGPLGDVVGFDNHVFHLSWYPVGLTAVSRQLAPPAWPMRLEGEQEVAVRIDTVAALSRIVVALGNLGESLAASTVEGGIVVAWGATGLADARSALHTRFDVGVTSRGRYHSIDTGKLTTAPLFAVEAAERIRAY